MTPHRFTAAACLSAAAEWRESDSEPHRAFVPTLERWAANHNRRADEAEAGEQPDLFERTQPHD